MSRESHLPGVLVRHTRRGDFAAITALCREVYPEEPPWEPEQLASHLDVFPEGQLVAVEEETGELVGMAASLILQWEDYDRRNTWFEFTADAMFTNHDPAGRTLYGAEVMVRPTAQGKGVGSKLYEARRRLCRRRRLARIRAGARLRGYHRFAGRMGAEEYVERVVSGEIFDPTLSFQLRQGFTVFAVVSGYLRADAASLGWAALIEWINPDAPPP